jgi:hypothetical protein
VVSDASSSRSRCATTTAWRSRNVIYQRKFKLSASHRYGRYHHCGLLKTAAIRLRRIICYLVDVQDFVAINGTKFQNRRAAFALFAATAAQQRAA